MGSFFSAPPMGCGVLLLNAPRLTGNARKCIINVMIILKNLNLKGENFIKPWAQSFE